MNLMAISNFLLQMKNNQVDVDTVIALAERAFDGDAKKVEMAQSLASDCAAVTDADRCEAAIKIFECGHIAAKTRGMNFEDV